MTTFVCHRCKMEKPTADFGPNRWTPYGHALDCRPCMNLKSKEYRQKNPEKTKKYGRDRYAKWRVKHPSPAKIPRENSQGRLCTLCEKRKPRDEFGFSSGYKDGRNNNCKECLRAAATASRYKDLVSAREKERAKAKAQYWKNPEKVKIQRARERPIFRYGITLEARDRMWLEQEKKCAICASPISPSNGKVANDSIHIDHDHDTGRVRGLLCRFCNNGLGSFRDSVVSLRQAILYLERQVRVLE